MGGARLEQAGGYQPAATARADRQQWGPAAAAGDRAGRVSGEWRAHCENLQNTKTTASNDTIGAPDFER